MLWPASPPSSDDGELDADSWTVDGPQRSAQGMEIVYSTTIGATEIALIERWFDPAIRTPVGTRYSVSVARGDVTIGTRDAAGGRLGELVGRVQQAHSQRIATQQRAARGDLAI